MYFSRQLVAYIVVACSTIFAAASVLTPTKDSDCGKNHFLWVRPYLNQGSILIGTIALPRRNAALSTVVHRAHLPLPQESRAPRTFGRGITRTSAACRIRSILEPLSATGVIISGTRSHFGVSRSQQRPVIVIASISCESYEI